MEQGNTERESKNRPDSPEPEGTTPDAAPRGGGEPAEIYFETEEELAEETADNEGFHAGRSSPDTSGDDE